MRAMVEGFDFSEEAVLELSGHSLGKERREECLRQKGEHVQRPCGRRQRKHENLEEDQRGWSRESKQECGVRQLEK